MIKKALQKAPEGQKRALLTKLRSLTPQDDDHLHDWVHLYLGVWIPREPHPDCRAKGHVAPFTAFADAYFARSDISVWKASRGLGGKSFLMATLTLTEMLTIGASTRVLGGSGKQSQNVHEYLRGTHPDVTGKLLNAKNSPRKWVTSHTATQQKSKNGGYAEALMASQTSVRGPHPQRLRLDEVDEMDIKIFDSAMGQTLDSPTVESQTVCSSTHQHPDGTFSEVIRRAKHRGWAIFEWCVAPETMISTPEGRRRIDRIQAGDQVYGYDGSGLRCAPVEWCGRTRTTRTYDILLSNGRTLRCSPEHLILSERGWLAGQEVTAGDRILSEVRRDTAFTADGPGKQDGAMRVVRETAQDCYPESLSGLWQGDSKDSETLPKVLHGQHGDAQQDALCSASRSTCSEDWVEEWQDIEGRAERSGAARSAGHPLDLASADARVRNGHSLSRVQSGDRCTQPLPSQSAGCSRTGREAQGGGTGQGIRLPNLLGGREAPVVEGIVGHTTVQEVLPGPEIELWDMTVPGLDSFVAEGVVVHNCYRENLEENGGWLTRRQVEKKRKQVTDQMWEAEFEGQEPNPGNRMFSPEQMQEIFPGDPDEQDLILAEAPFMREIVQPGPGQFYHGTDWGKSDYTVILTMIERSGGPDELAAYGMFNKMAWPEMVGLHNERVTLYGGVSAHDATGVGGVVEDYLTVNSEPFNFSSGRMELLNRYIGAGQNGEYVYPRIAPLYYAHKFLTYDHLLNRKHLPDEIAAAALAHHAKENQTSDIYIGRAV